MTDDERKKIVKEFGCTAAALARRLERPRRTMYKQLRNWLRGQWSQEEVFRPEKRGCGGRLERKFGFNVEQTAAEMQISPGTLRERLRAVEAGKKTLENALRPISEDINRGVPFHRVANLARIPGPGSWEKKYYNDVR